MATDHVDPTTEAQRPVREVMISRPKSVQHDAAVADARRAFENQSVRVLMVLDGDRYAGELRREDVPADAAGDAPVGPLMAAGEQIAPGAALADAIAALERSGGDRLAVVDGDRLVGLVCFSRSHGHLCVDARKP